MNGYVVSTFYAFFPLAEQHLPALKQQLLEVLEQQQVRGTILLATEGINATLCATESHLDGAITSIKTCLDCDFSQTRSDSPIQAFRKAKVRIKPVLVKIGAPIGDEAATGDYVEPQAWNQLIARSDVVVLDTRNRYETHLGTFQGAVDPDTRNFNHLPHVTDQLLDVPKDTPIATFCTGGIRCEKYTAWLKEQGYEQVYHLKGGILRYLAEIPKEESLWEGSCYVFDDRVAVGHQHGIDKQATHCPACGHTLVASDLRHPDYIANTRCRHCATHLPSNHPLPVQPSA